MRHVECEMGRSDVNREEVHVGNMWAVFGPCFHDLDFYVGPNQDSIFLLHYIFFFFFWGKFEPSLSNSARAPIIFPNQYALT